MATVAQKCTDATLQMPDMGPDVKAAVQDCWGVSARRAGMAGLMALGVFGKSLGRWLPGNAVPARQAQPGIALAGEPPL